MANDLSRGNVIIADTIGLLWKGWLKVRGFEYIPNAAGDACILQQYKTVTPIADSNIQITGTITSTTDLTDDNAANNKLTAAAFPLAALLHIKKSNGSTNNTKNGGLFLITTAGDNDVVKTSDAAWPLTNEAGKLYDLEAFAGTTFYHILSQATEKAPVHRWFGNDGILAENLALTTIGGGTLYIYI